MLTGLRVCYRLAGKSKWKFLFKPAPPAYKFKRRIWREIGRMNRNCMGRIGWLRICPADIGCDMGERMQELICIQF